MLSLVVCSVDSQLLSLFKSNVQNTIGVEYEFLIWDNTGVNEGLCKVYNKLAERAKFPYICFLHEDLKFQTQNWGQYFIDIFEKDPLIGLLGVAGGKYKSELYSGWYTGKTGLDYYHILHEAEEKKWTLSYPEKWEMPEVEVATIDGVFMFCRKEIWEQNKFDEETFTGFHFYDIDFSLRVAQNNKVVVTNKIDIIHFNKGGDYGDKWVRETFNFHRKRVSLLPFSVVKTNKTDVDISVAKYWLDWLKNQDISLSNRLKWIKDQNLLQHKELWYSVLKFILYRPLGLRKIHSLLKKK